MGYASTLRAAWALLGLALWLNANPYIGIDHDARLYVLAAYRWLNPDAFARDPWFLFGSQDDYSLFSPMLVWFLHTFGVANGALMATLLQGVLFSFACIFLGRAALGRTAYPLAALLMLSFPILYSPQALLFVTEGFVTARGFAIPISIMGLACAVQGRSIVAIAILVVASLLHPIMSAAPVAVTLFVLAPHRLRPWLLVLGWAGYLVALIAAIHGALPLMDGEWETLVSPSVLVFINPWISQVLPVFGFWAVLLAIAWRNGAVLSMRIAYGAVLPVIVSAVIFSLLATMVPWITALQAQFWRGLWLLKLMALCATADLLWCFVLAPDAKLKRVMSLGSILVVLLVFYDPLIATVALLGLYYLPHREKAESWLLCHDRTYLLTLLALLALTLPGLAFELTSRVRDVHIQGFTDELLHGFWRNAGFGTVALAVWWGGQRISPRMLITVAGIATTVAAMQWDGRSFSQKNQESRYSLNGSLSDLAHWIPLGSTVSWYGNTERIWFELATSGYAGAIHATGLVFSEGRTKLLADRYARLVLATPETPPVEGLSQNALRAQAVAVGNKNPFFESGNLRSYEGVGPPSSNGIHWLCKDPALDFVVDRQWQPSASGEVRESDGKLLFIYQCDKLVSRVNN